MSQDTRPNWVDELIEREGGDKVTNHPADRGGRTQYGITERDHPDLWADGKVTYDEARERFETRYLKAPGFDKIQNRRLREQLVDFGVNSGPGVATRKLQEILGVKADGILGPKTLAAVEAEDQNVLNNRLAVARLKLIGRIVQGDRRQGEFVSGWINRAVEFFTFS